MRICMLQLLKAAMPLLHAQRHRGLQGRALSIRRAVMCWLQQTSRVQEQLL